MEKKDYEIAADAFKEADNVYKQLESMFLDGSIVQACCPDPEDTAQYSNSRLIEYVQESYKNAIKALNELREDRNMKLVNAKNSMRAAVQLNQTQWRGPNTPATIVNYNSFTVSSVTRRKLDSSTLLALVAQKGKLKELMSLTVQNKDGSNQPAVKTETNVSYETVRQWLIENNLVDVLEASYDESESTPAVKGPKEVAFLGENYKD